MSKEHTYKLLDTIHYPEDLRRLDPDRLPEVCRELRQDIIDEVSCNPGHFAASLGVVELTVALHYVYNTPYDRLVWDVGHQAYGHKILTGRKDLFDTNRKYKGIRPFPSPEESEYDSFACGHASNSISAALGMAVSARLKGENDRHIVAVIGDGSMSGGLAFEGLNNASTTPNDLLIILNDNEMSIDRSVGGMRQYLLTLNTSDKYNRLRFKLSNLFKSLGLLNEQTRKGIIRFNNSLKSVLSKQQNVFEGMNIRYFGPVDGHNVTELVRTLRTLKDMKGPKLLHIHTVKGRGFAPAEEEATIWHAPGRFDPKTGKRLVENENGRPPLFQTVFGETLVERHAVTFSGGMAKEGMVPFCNIYSSFMQRAYDNIIHDVALLRLNVVLCLDRAGLVGEDGPTHHGVFDLACLRPVPHLTIASPYDEHELRRLMYTAQLPGQGPFVIRYPRGHGYLVDWRCPLEPVEVGRGRCLKEGKDLAVLTLGPIGHAAAEAIAEVERTMPGTSIAHYDLRFAKPLDTALLDEVAARFNRVVTVEDGILRGGVGSAVLEYMSDRSHTPRIRRIGIPDEFIEHGAVGILHHVCGMDREGIRDTLLAELHD